MSNSRPKTTEDARSYLYMCALSQRKTQSALKIDSEMAFELRTEKVQGQCPYHHRIIPSSPTRMHMYMCYRFDLQHVTVIAKILIFR